VLSEFTSARREKWLCYWWSDLRMKREMELVTCDITHLNTMKQQHWQLTECHSWVGSTPHFCSGFKLKSQPRYHLFSRCFMNFLSQARQMSVQYLELGHDHFFHIFNNTLFTFILPCNAISAIDSIQYSVPPVKTVLHKIRQHLLFTKQLIKNFTFTNFGS